MRKRTGSGPLHEMPDDLRQALDSAPDARATWDDITPLARNEWICWVTHPKKAETRRQHVVRAMEDLSNGKRRPCCWPGCPHRNPKAAKYFRK